jgi:CBS domain-containing protein
MHDVVEFLRRYPPFAELDDAAIADLARKAEVEYFAAGHTILREDAPAEHVWVVRRGIVEVVEGDRILDRLGEGEMVGQPSMREALQAGAEVRASVDTLCYRLPIEAVATLLAQPTTRAEPEHPVARLLRDQPVVCEPSSTVREAARRMAEAGASCALVRLADGELGILTDRDLRVRVVGGDVLADAPVTEAISAPAFTIGPERLEADVMLEMLDRGIRHVPVVSGQGEVLGVLSDLDLFAAAERAPFALRRDIEVAADAQELRQVIRRLHPAVVALHDAEIAPVQISGIIAVVADALTRRLIELTVEDLGTPPCSLTWLALGSLGRREICPSSDADSAIVWGGERSDDEHRSYAAELASRVTEELAANGFAADAHGATAAQPLFERSAAEWRKAIQEAVAPPLDEDGFVLISLMCDARAVCSIGEPQEVLDELRRPHTRQGLLKTLLSLAIAYPAPTGFRRFRDPPRDFVVEHSGEHHGLLDIKRGGMLPITAIARYGGLAAGAHSTSTRHRLRAAASAGALDSDAARTLEEAFDLMLELRLGNQVEQIRRGLEPNDFLDPEELNPLARRYLRDAFRAIASVQRALRSELSNR